MRIVLGLSLIAALPAAVQDCPANVETGPVIQYGTRVTVQAIRGGGTGDMGKYIGQSGTVGNINNNGTNNTSCWFSGDVTMDNGDIPYFNAVAFSDTGSSGQWSACAAGTLRGTISAGRVVVLDQVHMDDAYFSSQGIVAGATFTVVTPLHNNGECWFGGSIRGADGQEFYVYKASFRNNDNACPSNAIEHSIKPGGSLVIAALHTRTPPDQVALLPPGTLVVATEQITPADACWMSGWLELPSGTRVNASRVALTQGTGASRFCDESGVDIPSSGEVTVTAIHLRDAYAAVASDVVGLTGRISGEVTRREGCWVGVNLITDSGTRYRFDRVSITPSSTP